MLPIPKGSIDVGVVRRSTIARVLLIAFSCCLGGFASNAHSAPQELVEALQESFGLSGHFLHEGGFVANPPPVSSLPQEVCAVINGVWTTSEDFSDMVARTESVCSEPIGLYQSSALENAEEIADWLCLLIKDVRARIGCELAPYTIDLAEAAAQYVRRSGDMVSHDIVSKFTDWVYAVLKSGRKLRIIAHSQGSFFARDVSRELVTRPGGHQLSRQLGFILVGAPARIRDFAGLPVVEPPSGYLPVRTFRANIAGMPLIGNARIAQINACTDPIGWLGAERLFVHPGDTLWPSNAQFSDTVTLAFEQQPLFIVEPLPISTGPVTTSPVELKPEYADWADCIPTLSLNPHSYESYLTGNTLNALFDAFIGVGSQTVTGASNFSAGDAVITQYALNTRTAGSISEPHLYTVPRATFGTLLSDPMYAEGYHWSEVCWETGSRTTVGTPASPCGWIATDFVALASGPTYVAETRIPTTTEFVVVEPDSAMLVTTVNPSDDSTGLDACETSTCGDAPGTHHILSSSAYCVDSVPEITLAWTARADVNLWQIYSDEGNLLSTAAGSAVALSLDAPRVGKVGLFMKAINQHGSRNSALPHSVAVPDCGPHAPPPDIPIPLVTTGGVSDIDFTTATVHGQVLPQGAHTSIVVRHRMVGSTWQETSPYSIGFGNETIDYSRPISWQCGGVFEYQMIAQHNHGEVFGGERTVTTPGCIPNVPQNLVARYDPNTNMISARFDVSDTLDGDAVLYQALIQSDPAQEEDLGEWLSRPALDPGEVAFTDTYLQVNPGGEYCFRAYRFRGGTGEYSDFSNTACVSIPVTELSSQEPVHAFSDFVSGSITSYGVNGIRTDLASAAGDYALVAEYIDQYGAVQIGLESPVSVSEDARVRIMVHAEEPSVFGIQLLSDVGEYRALTFTHLGNGWMPVDAEFSEFHLPYNPPSEPIEQINKIGVYLASAVPVILRLDEIEVVPGDSTGGDSSSPFICLPDDKQIGVTDGWVCTADTWTWVSESCLADLAGHIPIQGDLDYATEISNRNYADTDYCSMLVPASTQPHLLLTWPKLYGGEYDGWMAVEVDGVPHQRWVSENCRSELEANGIATVQEEYATIAGLPTVPPLSDAECSALASSL